MNKYDRDYIYYEATTSLCPQCMETIAAKVVIKGSSVYLSKYCPRHGESMELLEEDKDYYLRKREFDKPGTASKTQTGRDRGCPYDCGLCPDHDQHSCIGLIEVTQRCDLGCSICYADAGEGEHMSLTKVEELLDFLLDTEHGQGEILQISGGEPTTHPNIIEIIKLARSKSFKYIMLNTNGLRIAEDEEFVRALKQFSGGFEVYLQFDGFDPNTYRHFRGRDLSELKKKAVENLTRHKIPTTLVCTVEKGVNDHELGEIIHFGIKTKYIRGINFQPVAYFGRIKSINTRDRITLSGVLSRIEKQTNGMITRNEFVPLPCNVERVAITYLYRKGEEFIPVTRSARIKNYLPMINNTFFFTIEDILKESGKEILKGESFCNCLNFLRDFRQIVPRGFNRKSKEEKMEYVDENTFRISVSSFVDAYNFDIKAMQKECVHVITPELRKIPFSAYNLLHRKGSIQR